MKKKLLFCIYSLGAGGAEKALINLLNSIDYNYYEVDLQLFENEGVNLKYLPVEVNLLTPLRDNNKHFGQGPEIIKNSLLKGDIISVFSKLFYWIFPKIIDKGNERLGNYFNWKYLRSRLRKNKKTYDIAIGYMHGVSNYYVVDCIKAHRKVCWVHTDYSKIKMIRQEEKYFKKAYKVITISEKCVEELQRSFPKLRNIELLYNVNSINLLKDLSSAYEPPEYADFSGQRILSVGRLHYLKGFDMAIEAAVILKKLGFNFCWYILGEGEIKAELEKKCIELGVEDYIKFLGIRTNPYPYILRANIIVQTSRYEGKSMVIDEAKILRKPIISTNYNSVEDQITDGLNGIIAPVSPIGIADALERLLLSSQQCRELEKNLKNLSNLYYEQVQSTILKHYKLFGGEL
ncbi:glycosyl transferase [Bacillus sp. AFS077874]|uniref:glycosyltransferase n=1 Tax=Bacillus sp. AFS077874 TaxID=2033513 RepID=UPI000BF829E8|nr:glycosyltransferase [Bacillus sp. AFS077874]PFM78972.1 glycosyl transferase [Bacillus sp. AFS077874]